MRNSKQREAILRVLENTKSHPSAEWLYEQVKNVLPGIGIATVYRNLRILRETGKILALQDLKGKARFDYNTAPHLHFYCVRCGKIQDVNENGADYINTYCSQKTGFSITRINVEITGLCEDCQKREPQS